MKHKHATEIIAWANGATIEVRVPDGKWVVSHLPYWHVDNEFRVATEPKPDVVRYAAVYREGGLGQTNADIDSVKWDVRHISYPGIIRITIDGETGKLSAEVV